MDPSSSGIQGRWRRGRCRNVTCCSRRRWRRREREEDIGVGNYAGLRGRWKVWEHHQNAANIHLRLVFACEGGGGVGSVERVFEGRCWRCAGCGLLVYLAGVRYHGSPMMFSTCQNPHTLPKSIDIDTGWPTSLVGGERPGGSEFGCGWT